MRLGLYTQVIVEQLGPPKREAHMLAIVASIISLFLLDKEGQVRTDPSEPSGIHRTLVSISFYLIKIQNPYMYMCASRSL